ncbi:MAG: SCP2 sterol-binding domain-containing protein [Ilumatobacteraceae bacterium]|jgi:putative sterol carrier protein|nr:SCP2 sterol-binding domain-containing protein [Ilumatobacteraceae bacterium]
MAFPFLSQEWMDAAKAIRAKYQDQAPKITAVIRINQVITDVPFGEGTVKSYMDTSSGDMEVELGELENPDATVTTDWATARAIFALNDQAAAMQAFMGGKIKVAGDMMKMMALQTQMPQTDITAKVAEEIKAITE